MAQVSGWVRRSARAAAADDERGGGGGMVGGGGRGLFRRANWASCFCEDARSLSCAFLFSWSNDPTNMAWSWRSIFLASSIVLAAARERAVLVASAARC